MLALEILGSTHGAHCWGIPASSCADRECTDSCSTEGKHTDTIFYVVRQIRLHPRERFILLEIEKGYNKYMEEEDHIHSTLLPAHTHSCCSCCNGSRAAAHGSSSSFSLLLVTSLSALSTILSNISLFYRHFMVNMEGPIALKHGMNCGTICRYTKSGDGSRYFFVYLTKRVFSIGGNKDFIGVAI